VLKASNKIRRRREAAWILAGGAAIAAAPALWYSRVWPDAVSYGQANGPTQGAWWFVFACSIGPFILVAALCEATSMSRVAIYGASLVAAVMVVLAQLAGLDPHDPSSTASIAGCRDGYWRGNGRRLRLRCRRTDPERSLAVAASLGSRLGECSE
jgi:hypothetical protein